jgi:hypothetical protein
MICRAQRKLPRYSHLNLDTQNTLSEQNVSDGLVNEVLGRLTRVDHETVGELQDWRQRP